MIASVRPYGQRTNARTQAHTCFVDQMLNKGPQSKFYPNWPHYLQNTGLQPSGNEKNPRCLTCGWTHSVNEMLLDILTPTAGNPDLHAKALGSNSRSQYSD
jgi:hypothetical protein